MGYQERIDSASRQVFDDKWRGNVSVVSVQHDDWCAIYKGRPCNCDPDITMNTPTGRFMVDRRGRASIANKEVRVSE
jgi:hypothetical protein